MRLDENTFIKVIEAAPLVAIDLVVRNEHGQVLLGRRVNRPAQGFWFVPGGRIRKNERVRDALARISQSELGVVITPGGLLGIFDHLYEDNFLGRAGVSTHYVVLGYACQVDGHTVFTPDTQHSALHWWDVAALLESSEVHDNTKLYFRQESPPGFRCGDAPV